MKATNFNHGRFNQMIAAYNEVGNLTNMPSVETLEDFRLKYPVTTKTDLREISRSLALGGHFKSGYIIATSGTTSEPLVLGHRIWNDVSEGTYPYEFYVYLLSNVFNEDDVAANLFRPGGLGVVYEAANRFLEPIGATILPIGVLDSIQCNRELLRFFRDLGLNTVIGTPPSVVQFALNSEIHGVELNIRKIVYTGEPFYPRKRDIIKRIWKGAEYYSLFGGIEYGYAAISTPSMPSGVHEVLEDWYFFETDDDGSILVTDLTTPIVPVVRYKIGDRGRIIPPYKEGAGAGLIIGGRSDSTFNLVGNAVSYDSVCRVIENKTGCVENLQIILETQECGQDLMTVAIDADVDQEPTLSADALSALMTIVEIEEGVSRGVVTLKVSGREALQKNWRTKTRNVIDLRGDGIVIQGSDKDD
ncbi:hypothetical protein ACFWXH_22015 [Mesorhizobium sp. NPDC059054]|uniref:hypothetical protein n=1 Tax=Mesorhizobium sp. NPDC059054 TaxID=3346711 RepID=UPI0036C3E138